MNKKICFIMPNVFPVPATKGGATETIVNNVLDENEKQGKLDFTCISVYEEEAVKKSKSYLNTKFIFIENEKRDSTVDLTFTTLDKTFKTYMDNIYIKIKDMSFDFIIIEGGDITGYEYLIKKLPNQRFLVHIHGNVLGNNQINAKIYEYFIAISRYTEKLILQDAYVNKNQVKLLHNSIKIEDFKKDISEEEKIELRKKYGINENDNVLVYFGRMIPEKGVKELIQSFKKLRKLNNTKLLIVGNSHYGDKVKSEYDKELEKISESVKDKIKFTGYVKNDELYKIHQIADIAVLPSMWEELFGLVFVEAMSSGLPIVTTKSGGIVEVVDESCSFILEKNENLIDNMTQKIDYLIDNPDIRKKMGQAGKKRSELFDISRYYENFIQLIEEII